MHLLSTLRITNNLDLVKISINQRTVIPAFFVTLFAKKISMPHGERTRRN